MENNIQPENNNVQPVNETNFNPTNTESVAPQFNSAPPVESVPPVNGNVQQPYNNVPPVDNNVQQPYNNVPPVNNNVQQPYNNVPPVNNNVQQPYNNQQQMNNNYQQPYNQPQPNYSQPQQPFTTAPNANYALVPVNKIVYIVLAFFLGGLGIHKFYAGKTTQGILYLVFCWTLIPSFIAFIDFIIALTKPADINGNIYI